MGHPAQAPALRNSFAAPAVTTATANRPSPAPTTSFRLALWTCLPIDVVYRQKKWPAGWLKVVADTVEGLGTLQTTVLLLRGGMRSRRDSPKGSPHPQRQLSIGVTRQREERRQVSRSLLKTTRRCSCGIRTSTP